MAKISINLNSNRHRQWFHHLHLLVLLFISMVPSSFAISITNLNVTDSGSYYGVFEWDVVDIGAENNTDSLRSYIQVKYGFNWVIEQQCLSLNKTTAAFESLQPFTGYTACISVVRVSVTGGKCEDDSPRVTVNEVCKSLVTDFELLSQVNLTALACVCFIIIVLVVTLIISFACPDENMNDTLDKKKMKAWSKKKRTESVHDFLQSFKSRSNSSND